MLWALRTPIGTGFSFRADHGLVRCRSRGVRPRARCVATPGTPPACDDHALETGPARWPEDEHGSGHAGDDPRSVAACAGGVPMAWIHDTGYPPAYRHTGYVGSVLADGTDT